MTKKSKPDFSHLNNQTPEQIAAFRATMARIGDKFGAERSALESEATAERIIEAGKRARGERDAPAPTGLAGRIIAAAKKAAGR